MNCNEEREGLTKKTFENFKNVDKKRPACLNAEKSGNKVHTLFLVAGFHKYPRKKYPSKTSRIVQACPK